MHSRVTENFARSLSSDVVFSCIDQIIPQNANKSSTANYIIYLATDSRALQLHSKDYYGENVIWYSNVLEADSDIPNPQLRSDVETMFVDITLLSSAP